MSRRLANPSAWLASIELENVRCFRERQVVPFTTSDGKKAQWTLLLGENGTGKSTLLEMCARLIPRTWEPREDGTIQARSLVDDGGWLVGGFRLPRTMSPRAARTSVALSVATENAVNRWSWEMDKRGFAPIDNPSFRADPFALPPCLAYGPYRSPWMFIPEDTSPDRTRGLSIGFTRLRHPGQWFQDRTFAAVNPDSDDLSRSTAGAILDHVRETLLSLLPDVSELRIDTEFGGRGPNRLRAKTPFGWVDIDKLGMGFQSVLALTVDIASRLVEHYPDSPHPLEEAAVVLVDEVDLHLHPTWQRALQQQLSERFPKVQFIATAHSPLVVQSSPNANIILLRRDGDHVVIEPAPDTVKTWRVDQILTSDLFGLPSARPPSLDSLITERDAILGKPELSNADEQRLEKLRARIGELPGGESPWQMEAMELIQKVAKTLEPTAKKTTRRAPRETKRRK